MSMREAVRLVIEHSERCWVRRNGKKIPTGGHWAAPVVVERGHAVRFLCPDPACGAYVDVSLTSLSELLERSGVL